MSSAITITITANRGYDLPTRGQLEELGDGYKELLGSCDDYSVHPSGAKPYISIQWYDERWGVDDGMSFCQDAAEAFPGLLIQHMDEWNGVDEEGAGAQGYEWLGGRIIREGSTQFIWQEVTPVTQ